MAFQSAPNIAQASVISVVQDIPINMSFYFRMNGGYDETDIITLANIVDLWVDSFWKPLIPTEQVYQRTEVRGLQDENDFLVVDTSSAGAGGVASPAYNPTVALAVSRRSAFTGRSARGRVFWGAIPTSQVETNSSLVASTYANPVVAALEDLNDAALIGDWVPVILSRFAAGVARPEAIPFLLLNWFVTDLVLDNQRRRKP